MNSSKADNRLLRILVSGACLVVIVTGMRAMAPILNIVFLAWLLAIAISPLPNFMMRNHVPRIPAALSTLLIVIFGGIAIAMVMSYSIIGLSRKLPQYYTILADTYGRLVDSLAARGVDITQSTPLAGLTPSRIFEFISMILGQVGNLLGNTLLLLILVAILLFEFLDDPKRPAKHKEEEMSGLWRSSRLWSWAFWSRAGRSPLRSWSCSRSIILHGTISSSQGSWKDLSISRSWSPRSRSSSGHGCWGRWARSWRCP